MAREGGGEVVGRMERVGVSCGSRDKNLTL